MFKSSLSKHSRNWYQNLDFWKYVCFSSSWTVTLNSSFTVNFRPGFKARLSVSKALRLRFHSLLNWPIIRAHAAVLWGNIPIRQISCEIVRKLELVASKWRGKNLETGDLLIEEVLAPPPSTGEDNYNCPSRIKRSSFFIRGSRRDCPWFFTAPTQFNNETNKSFNEKKKRTKACANEKCLVTKHYQTLFGDQTFYRLATLFGAVWSCLIVPNRVWSCLINFEGHQTFDQKLKLFLLFSCLMGDFLFVWTAAYQTCLMWACVPRLLSGLYQLFHLCLIKHVLIVWPLTSTLACLVTKQCLMVFGHQTFLVCPGPKASANEKCLVTKQHRPFGDQTFYRLATLFDAVWSHLIVLGRIWQNLKAIKHSIKKLKHFFCFRVWWAMFCSFGQLRIKHVWCGHACHACSAVCIKCLTCVWSIMFWSFGHTLRSYQRVWSPNNVWWWLVAKYFPFAQAFRLHTFA